MVSINYIFTRCSKWYYKNIKHKAEYNDNNIIKNRNKKTYKLGYHDGDIIYW